MPTEPLSPRSVVVAIAFAYILSACGGSVAHHSPYALNHLRFPAPRLTSQSRVTIQSISARRVGAGYEASITPVTITIRPTKDHATVTVKESESSDNEVNKAVVWLATLIASEFIGQPLHGYAIDVQFEGAFHSLHAAPLLAAGIMAAMTNTSVKKGVTLAGMLRSNGSVGPVGGLAKQLREAIKRNIKVFCFPLGQQAATDPATGKPYDLEQIVGRNPITLSEVDDVYDAFQALTGQPFPRLYPRNIERMALTKKMKSAGKNLVRKLLDDGEALLKEAKPLVAKLKQSGFTRLHTYLEGYKKTAERVSEKYSTAVSINVASFLHSNAFTLNQLVQAQATHFDKDEEEQVQAMITGELNRTTATLKKISAHKDENLATVQLTAESVGQLLGVRWFMRRAAKDVSEATLRSMVQAYSRVYRHKMHKTLMEANPTTRNISDEQLARAARLSAIEAKSRIAYTRAYVNSMPKSHRAKGAKATLTRAQSILDETRAELRQSTGKKRPERKNARMQRSQRFVQIGGAIQAIYVIGLLMHDQIGMTKNRSAALASRYTGRLARTVAADADARLGSVPPMALFYFQIAEDFSKRKKYENAERYYSRALAECRLALRLGLAN